MLSEISLQRTECESIGKSVHAAKNTLVKVKKKKKKAQLAGAFSPKNNCTLKGPWNTDNTRAN